MENEDQQATAEQVVTPEKEAPETGTEVKTEGEGGEQPVKPEDATPDWLRKKLDKATFHRRQAERERDAALAQLAALNKPTDGEKPKPSEVDVDALVEQRVRLKTLNEAADRVFDAGVAEYKDDFVKARDNLGAHFAEELAARPDFFEAITALEDGHKVYYALGKDLDEAARILNLPPAKMGIELAKLAAKKPKTSVSKAPAPTTPIGGTGKVEADPSKMSMDEWNAWYDRTYGKK